MGRADEEVPHDVVLLQPGALYPFSAALLAAVQVGFGALGVPGFGDRDDDVFARDQVLVADFAVGGDDPGAAVVAVLLDDLGELVVHDPALALRLGQDVFQVGDFGFDLGQVVEMR